DFIPHVPLLRRTSSSASHTAEYLSIRRTPYLKIFSATSFAEPKLSELVSTLTGESNFASWSTALKYALDTRDPYLFEILTGHTAQPASEDPSLPDLRPSTSESSEYILISIFSNFIISENRRLASYPNFTSDPIFYDANTVSKPGNAKPKHFYTFYQRKTVYTSEEYFKNLANANANNNANTTKSVNAINAPALISDNNSIVRYNNLFTN
ncbi:hypothetical protein N7501_000031, partial [Penicillium viridicatum]